MASGAREIAAPAMSAAWSTPLLLEKRVSAEGRVRWLMSLVTTSGQRKSFHSAVNWMINSEARTGLELGMMIRQKTSNELIWRRQKMGFPFPYQRFLLENRSTFLPLLNQLSLIDFPLGEFAGYDQLLQASPPQLWRLISTAIWVQRNLTGPDS